MIIDDLSGHGEKRREHIVKYFNIQIGLVCNLAE
jgi:hypothetical protein